MFMKRMTAPEQERIKRMLSYSGREREKAYEDVRTGKVPGRIDFNGDITVRVDALSSVIYRKGSTTYVW